MGDSSLFNTLAFVTQMSEKRTSTSPSAIQVKNQWETISTEKKLDVISQLEKGEWIAEICCNVRFAHVSVCTIHDNNDWIAIMLNHELKCLCSKTTTVLSEWTLPKTMWVSYIIIALEIHILCRTICILYRNVYIQ
jgi:hypothetical protein